MEDYALDVMIGKGPSARSLRLSLKPFTIVGATTRAGRISSPLRDRFGATYRLDFYAENGAGRDRRALGDDPGRDDRAGGDPGDRPARPGTPRIVNRLLKRVRDHAQVHGDGHVDEATATAAMRAMEIDDEGLDRPTASSSPRSSRSSRRGRSASRRWRPSCPRRPRRSRTSTSRSCCASGSSIGRRRAGSPRTSPARTCRASATRSRHRDGGSRACPACGTSRHRRTRERPVRRAGVAVRAGPCRRPRTGRRGPGSGA